MENNSLPGPFSAMSSLSPALAATWRARKRARTEEPAESLKVQRQSGFQSTPRYPSDFASGYPQAPLEYTPRSSSSSPPVHSEYPVTSDAYMKNTQGIETGYRASQSGVSASDPAYDDLVGHYGLAVASQPPPVPQSRYGYSGHVYQYPANGRPDPPMQATYTPEPPTPQVSRNHGPNISSQPLVTASTPTLEQPIEERLFWALTGAGYGKDDSYLITAEQVALENLYAEQTQWLIKAEADLQEWEINFIPAIPLEQGTLGAPGGIGHDLVPSDVWCLRSLSPSLRYSAYRMMTEEARKMVKYDQASEEYQKGWKKIARFREYLMQKEREWVRSFDQIVVTHIWACWKTKVQEQAIETAVDQAMIYDVEQSMIKARGTSLVGVTVDNEARKSLASEPVPANEKTTKKDQSPVSQPTAVSIAPPKLDTPGTIKHPSDKVLVPEYPSTDIDDFIPNSETGRYSCMHSWWTNKDCCKFGLDRDQMKQAILRSVTTWKSKVERLIEEGDLHPSHMTWTTYQNQALRKSQKTAGEKRVNGKARDGGGEAEQSVKKKEELKQQRLAAINRPWEIETEKKRKDWKQTLPEDDASSGPSTVPVSHSSEQRETTTRESLPKEAATQTAFDWGISRVDMRNRQDFEDCRRLEHQKKWPNWPRFEEWWAARLVQVQRLQLSPEQKAILKGPEPSSIADENPGSVEKTKEPLPLQVQESVGVEENVGLDESGLDNLFEDSESDA